MKKLIALLVVFIMSMALAACGGSSGSEKSETTIVANTQEETTTEEMSESDDSESETRGEVGEVISSDIFDICLSEVNYSDSISNIVDSSDMGLYYRPSSDARELITADNGNKLLSFIVSLKYTGTKETALNLGDGSTADVTGPFLGFLVKYDEKYEFKTFALSGSAEPDTPQNWEPKGEISGYMVAVSGDAFKFKPLETNTHEYRVYMQIPEQVAEKAGKSVNLIISLGEYKYVFDIKP